MTPQSLTLTAPQIRRLRDHLLRDDNLERFAFIHCNYSGDRLLAEEIVPISDDQLEIQGPSKCRPQIPVELDRFQECYNRDMHPVVIHSHPFSDRDWPRFSSYDHDMLDRWASSVDCLWPDTTFGFAVLNRAGIKSVASPPDAEGSTDLPTHVLGNRWLDTPVTTAATETPDVDLDGQKHDRTIRAFSKEDLQRLAATHIAVVGVGGLGSRMAADLASTGVRELTVVDPDVVERSNLPRLTGIYGHHVGRPKVEAIKEELHRRNPDIEVTAVHAPAEEAGEQLKQADLILAGVDQVTARMWLNQFAVRHLIPYCDAGVIIETDDGQVERMEGCIQLVVPGVTSCYDCLNRGDNEIARIEQLSEEEREEELKRGYIDGTHLSPDPAVLPLNAMVAAKAVSTVTKHIIGHAMPEEYLLYDDISNNMTDITTAPRDEQCITCGEDGVLGRGDRQPAVDEADATDLDLTAGLDPGEPSPNTGVTVLPPSVAVYFRQLHKSIRQ